MNCSVRCITICYSHLCNGSVINPTSVNCYTAVNPAVLADGNIITTR